MMIGLLVAGASAYYNSFSGAMLLDDESSIIKDQTIRRLWPPDAYLTQPRPLLRYTLALNYAFGGLETAGYHAVNLIIHLLAGLALFGVIRRTLLLPRFEGAFNRQASVLAFVISLLWIGHPLQTGSVTYIVQRGEAMMGLFYLTALYGLIRASQARQPWVWYVASILAFTLGVASKEVIITAPAVLLLYDRMFLVESWRELFRKRWAFYTLPYLPGLLWFFIRFLPLLTPSDQTVSMSAGINVQGLTPWMYARTQPEIILHYLRLVFWPHPLILNYEWPVVHDVSAMIPAFMGSGILLAVSLYAVSRNHPAGFPALAFFIILAPTSSVLPIRDLAFEHRMYLPLACVITLTVFGCRMFVLRYRPNPWIPGGVVALITLGLIFATNMRNRDYQSPTTMWTAVLEWNPRNYRALVNMGTARYREQRLEEALAYYLKAIEVQSTDPTVFYNLGMTLQKLERTDEAEGVYRRALELKPPPMQLSLIHNQLGLIAIGKKDDDRALTHFQQAVQSDPTHAIAQKNLALSYLRKNEFSTAETHLNHAIQTSPEYADAYYWMGFVHEYRNRPVEAMEAYRQALRYNPGHADAGRRLAGLKAR